MSYENIIQKIEPIVKLFRENEDYELEGILGIKSDTFVSGVEFEYFEQLYTILSQTDVWTDTIDCEHFATYYFPGNIRGRFTGSTSSFVEKTNIAKVDIESGNRNYNLRINLKQEKIVQQPSVNLIPLSVRLQERSSFIYKNAWRYDFTKVASGKDKESACANSCVFEIELEILRSTILAKNTLSDIELATHLVYKLIDLLGNYDHNFIRQDIVLNLK